MPRRDGTGPMGVGPMTGRGLGICTGINAAGFGEGPGMGLGLSRRWGLGRGFGRGFVAAETSSKTQKELLEEQRDLLDRKSVV